MSTQAKSLFYITIAVLAFILGYNANASVPPLKVAVIDSGFGFDVELHKKTFKICKSGSYDFTTNTHTVGDDMVGHGTVVTGLLNQHADTKNLCYIIYKVLKGKEFKGYDNVNRALSLAYKNKVDVVNLSLEMYAHDDLTRRLIKSLTKRGTKVFVAAGNDGLNLNVTCNRYPACFKRLNQNFNVVGATDEDGDVAKYSNRGAFISVYKYGRTSNGARGTSFASPRAAGDYIKSLNYDKRGK